ncbi:biosynthetic-type acetolactate synthase large subunit [Paenibacillus polymyxa]|jgi:acetolactate synthase-1/2/3 large subunit|uniref:biosynthetic-type acetolactate synthase large subunit n=1 Tax=Paenibacillus polymyxa TaxID=1406 RepID=UPI000D8D9A4F|nr:biosynthetic-type acetolactate synthase large subunit [Paenibacillus polymyxa]MBY0020601.1 biosynthetic-type acetolactate synthase large subunit [Paenibacillus polymyxa]MBY0058905.1 biosynthetic-type acetolactate synthase large subunit [Paenibacillus polymyxa]MBY0069492.1 biosynthetic-type acetolactate synthase large subunit [Paenibacillus polymyxa]MBY0078734.1 biosynthetic-type acetolactate synthase large subunit [Paenibacillus polymyxa]MBZ6441995.1 biosynthetic-type acetolactate synthase 
MSAQIPEVRSTDELREKWMKPEVITGSEILLRSLLLEGVDCVFGYPGGAVLYIYDAMYGFKDFKHVLTRHEQGAIHAADGYARASGKVGVCIATSGPGATNLVTGIATAYMDSVPLVVITGNVVSSLIGTDAFQEADITGITMPITKHSYLVRDVEDLPRIIHEAFHIANTGRKGPVLIDIPKDVSAAQTLFVPQTEPVTMRGYNPNVLPNKIQLDKLTQAIAEAERPFILAGGGVVYSGGHEALYEFVRKTEIPIATTLLGLGGFPSGHELWTGMPGMHGTYTSNQAIQQSDLLICIGARFDDRVTGKLDGFAPQAKIVHIDIDPAEIGKNVAADIPIVGDVKAVLELLNQDVKRADLADAWRAQIQQWKAAKPFSYKDSETVLKPQWVIELLDKTTKGGAIVTTDVGQHQMWAAQYYKFNQPRSWVTSGGLGTMGFGFPSAIGAQMANPDRLVISINGDGGMQMCSQELAICAINNIPVKIVIINNQVLGMVRQWQELIYNNRYSHIDLAGSPDFVKLAEAYGVKGLRATNKEEARRAWQEALDTPGPVVVEFVVSKEENVYPMVTQGSTIDQMLMGDE